MQTKVVHSRSLDKVSSYEENAELTQGIQELHALVCAYLNAQYKLLVMQCHSRYDSPHIDYQQLKSPLQSWTEEEVSNGKSEAFFLTTLHDDLLESHLLPVLHRMGMDRHVPSWNCLPSDVATVLQEYFNLSL